MKVRIQEPLDLGAGVLTDAALARDHVEDRVRHFARLRAAHRALTPSSAQPHGEVDGAVVESVRECLRTLRAQVDPSIAAVAVSRAKLQELDEGLDAYQKALVAWAARLPLAQLRASLATETHDDRVEVAALLQICLETEAVPKLLLPIVDFLITLLCASQKDGAWWMDVDPADLNDVIRARCAAAHLEPSIESQIMHRFQRAAEQLATAGDTPALVDDISAYKAEVAGFYFAPSILRCIVGYNIAARNHFENRVRRGREMDAALDGDLGSFAPLQRDDPRAARTVVDGGLPARQSPGVLAVQDAIRRRLGNDVSLVGPAERIAAALDLGWLEEADRGAFLDPEQSHSLQLIRLTVVLGHLAMISADHAKDLAALSLSGSQIDAWICELADEVQREMDTLIRSNRFDGAVRLGEVKSRFLTAVRVVARRRIGRTVAASEERTLSHEATDLLRDYLARERERDLPMFNDLLGGGWRRTVALSGVGLLAMGMLLGEAVPSRDPRRVDDLDARQSREISPLLASGYRDHAAAESMFIGTVTSSWDELGPAERRAHAELIRDRVRERGVKEVLLFDRDHVLRAHWADGRWSAPADWGH